MEDWKLLMEIGKSHGFNASWEWWKYQTPRLKNIFAAQQGVQLTALRRGLAVSIFINFVLLAVVLFTIGGN